MSNIPFDLQIQVEQNMSMNQCLFSLHKQYLLNQRNKGSICLPEDLSVVKHKKNCAG